MTKAEQLMLRFSGSRFATANVGAIGEFFDTPTTDRAAVLQILCNIV